MNLDCGIVTNAKCIGVIDILFSTGISRHTCNTKKQVMLCFELIQEPIKTDHTMRLSDVNSFLHFQLTKFFFFVYTAWSIELYTLGFSA